MRKWMVIAPAAVFAAALVFLSNRDPAAARPAPVAPTEERKPAPGPRVASTPPPPVPVEPFVEATPVHDEVPEPVQVSDPAPAPPTPTIFPPSIGSVPMTAWREEQLARLEPLERSMLDYKLGLMDRMRDCLDGRGLSSGRVEVFLHFSVDDRRWQGAGSGADLLDSTLEPELDAVFLECLTAAHGDAVLPLEALPEDAEYHWATHFDVPFEEDDSYLFFVR